MKTTTKLHFNPKAESVDIILHGASSGIESSFMEGLFEKSIEVGNSAMMFNFPYIEQGEGSRPSDDLREEVDTLDDIVKFVKQFDYKHVRFMGKSLGGLVASKYISEILSVKQVPFTYELIIMGCIVPYYDFKISGVKSVTVIQGSDDDYGKPIDVEELLSNIVQGEDIKVQVHEVKNANHSYHAPGTKDKAQVEQAISFIV